MLGYLVANLFNNWLDIVDYYFMGCHKKVGSAIQVACGSAIEINATYLPITSIFSKWVDMGILTPKNIHY